MQTNFIPIDYDYFDFQGKNYIKIIGRTDTGKRICVIDDFQGSFWAILKNNFGKEKINKLITKIEKIKIYEAGRESKVEKVELHDKNFLGKPVKALKIFVTNFKDAHRIADKLGYKEIFKRREYDLDLITKYIMEKKIIPFKLYEVSGQVLNNSQEFGWIDSSMDIDLCIKAEKIKQLKKEIKSKEIPFKPKVLAYDIEVDDLKIGGGEILMVSLVSNKIKKVISLKKSNQKFVEHAKDEADLLNKFIKEVKAQNPDFLVGYYSDGFDLPYLKARAEKNKIKLALGIDNTSVKFSRGRNLTAKISGIVHIDLLRFIKTAYAQYLQSETLSLNEVANELLGERKKDFEIKHSKSLGEDEWLAFHEYNLQDSILTYKLFQKMWPDMLEFSRIMQTPIFTVSRNGMSKNVESYVIHNLEKFNEIVEKRPVHEEISKRRLRPKYEGAFVLQPKPGLYENLAMFDFTSMYASVIVSYNLSLSTHLNGDKFSKQRGFFPKMLEQIINYRKKFKIELKKNPNPMVKARSNAYKLLANAAYGYQGFFGARYYCLEAAAATAALAKKSILDVIEKIKKQGYHVVYSDTDSIALLLKNKTKSQTLTFLKQLNKNLPGIMELDLEDFYKRGIWVTKRTGDFGAKKKYALINHKGKVKIRGFETVRRDWCRLARNLQNKIIRMVLKEGNEKHAVEYLKDITKKLKNREIDKKLLIIKTQLKKPLDEYKAISPHVVAARRMIEKSMPVDMGMLIEYFVAETRSKKALVRDKVKLVGEKGEYNIKYYLNRQILPAVENILQVFDINTKELIEGKKQMKLGEF